MSSDQPAASIATKPGCSVQLLLRQGRRRRLPVAWRLRNSTAAERGGEVWAPCVHSACVLHVAHDWRRAETGVQERQSERGAHLAGILAAYDFTGFTKIVDVAGGHGALLRGILEHYPKATGVLCDLPSVLANADEVKGSSVATRCELVGADMLRPYRLAVTPTS
jgi:hypothetical protein